MINERDCSCTVNEAEFFDPIDKQVTLDTGHWVDVHPLNNIADNAPIEFRIQGSSDEVIDFNNTKLVLRLKIVNGAAGNANLLNADVVAPINNWLHSAFSDVILSIGGTQVEGGNQNYPYKALFTNLLTHGTNSKKTQLKTSGWYKDTTAHMNAATVDNKGFTARRSLVRRSQSVELCGPLLLDFFQQNKYCVHNVDVDIKLIPSKVAFQSLIYTANDVANRATSLKVVYEKAILYVRRVKPIPSFINSIEERLNLQNALYPLQRSEMITYSIPANQSSHNKESLFRGQMPKLILVGFVRNDAYNGVYNQNPFNFENFGINTLTLYREGESIPGRGLTPNFENKLCMREYINLMHSVGIYNKNDDIDLTPEEFIDGYTIFGFNLTPDLDVSGHAQPVRNGNLRMEVGFHEDLNHSVNVIVMGIFDACLEITKMRNVLMDWKM